MVSCRKLFPISEEEMAERIERSQEQLLLLYLVENKLPYVNTEMVLNKVTKFTG